MTLVNDQIYLDIPTRPVQYKQITVSKLPHNCNGMKTVHIYPLNCMKSEKPREYNLMTRLLKT